MKSNLLYLSAFLCANLHANSINFLGTSGSLNTPNARMHEDFTGAFFSSYSHPFWQYGASFAILPKIEINAHMNHQKAHNAPTQDNKILSLKVSLLPESDYFPALAFGINDMWGNLSFASKYIVASKKIWYFDIALGWATGFQGGSDRYKKYEKNESEFLKDSSLHGGSAFGSIEFLLHKNISLFVEYDPSDYKLLDYKLKHPSKSEVNAGVKFNYKDFQASFALMRGNALSLGFAYYFDANDLTKNMQDGKFSSSLIDNLNANHFSDIKLSENDNSLWLSAKNHSTTYDLKALKKFHEALSNSDQKDRYEYLYFNSKKADSKTIKANIKELDLYQKGSLSSTYMKNALSLEDDEQKAYEDFMSGQNARVIYKGKSSIFDYAFLPSIEAISVKSGDKVYLKAGINAQGLLHLKDYLLLQGDVFVPFFNSLDDYAHSNIYERKNGIILDRFSLDFAKNFSHDQYLSLNSGALNPRLLGFNVEYQKAFFDQRFGVSLQYQGGLMRKSSFGLSTKPGFKNAKFINLYYQLSKEKNTHIGAKIGEFLNEDHGYKLELNRTYKNFKIATYFAHTRKHGSSKNIKGFYLDIPINNKYLNSTQRKAHFNLRSHQSNFEGDYFDTYDSLINRLSNENNLQIIKKKVDLLK